MPTPGYPAGEQRSVCQTRVAWRTCRRRSKVSLLLTASSFVRCLTGDTATHLNNFIFDGARADLMKGLSMDPAFQVTHSFQLASQSTPPTYSFGALFANAKVSYGSHSDLSKIFTELTSKRSSFKETSTMRVMFPDDSSKAGQRQIPPRCRPKYVVTNTLLNHLLIFRHPSLECNPAIL